jgi:type I restriction enzyme S subunit
VVASSDLTPYYLLEAGDFAYNKSYSAGYPVGVIRRLDRYESGVVSPLYICFRPRSSRVDSDFLEQLLRAGKLDDSISLIAKEGARNHGLLNVGTGDFFGLTVDMPPLEEQRRIAEILNTIDETIRVTERVIAKLRVVRLGLASQLVDRGWDVQPLREMAQVISKGTTPTTYGHSYVQSGVPFIRVENLRADGFIEGETLFIGEDTHRLLRRSMLKGDDVLVSIAGTIGRVARLPVSLDGANCNQAVAFVRLRQPMAADFVAEYLRGREGQRAMLGDSVQLAQANLSLARLRETEVPAPPASEALLATAPLKALDLRIAAERRRLEKTRHVRVGLAADLLGGRVRTVRM